ncbi:MAG: hypothetical protein WCH46_10175 [bacterium]
MEFPESIKLEAFRRAAGKCECHRTTHHHSGRCNAVLGTQWYVHAKRSLRNSDDVTFTNSEALCTACHKARQMLGVI